MRLKITKMISSSGLVTWFANAQYMGANVDRWSTDKNTASWLAVNHCFWQAHNDSWGMRDA
jgi:hypothetical protein